MGKVVQRKDGSVSSCTNAIIKPKVRIVHRSRRCKRYMADFRSVKSPGGREIYPPHHCHRCVLALRACADTICWVCKILERPASLQCQRFKATPQMQAAPPC